jgi:hypothetical protein
MIKPMMPTGWGEEMIRVSPALPNMPYTHGFLVPECNWEYLHDAPFDFTSQTNFIFGKGVFEAIAYKVLQNAEPPDTWVKTRFAKPHQLSFVPFIFILTNGQLTYIHEDTRKILDFKIQTPNENGIVDLIENNMCHRPPIEKGFVVMMTENTDVQTNYTWVYRQNHPPDRGWNSEYPVPIECKNVFTPQTIRLESQSEYTYIYGTRGRIDISSSILIPEISVDPIDTDRMFEGMDTSHIYRKAMVTIPPNAEIDLHFTQENIDVNGFCNFLHFKTESFPVGASPCGGDW